MDKESFITLLQRSSPDEIRKFIERKGKRKLINPFIYLPEELPPDRKLSKEGAIEGEVRPV